MQREFAIKLQDPTDKFANQFSADKFEVVSREILLNSKTGISSMIGVLDDSKIFSGYEKPDPFFDFVKLFRPKTDQDNPQAVIEELDPKTVVDVFNSNFDAMKREILRARGTNKFPEEENEELETKREKEKNELLEALGFTDSIEKVQLVPRKNYDKLIDTNTPSDVRKIQISREQSIKNAAEAF